MLAEQAVRSGIPRETAWRLTVQELFEEFAIARWRADDRYNRDVLQAWFVEAFARSDRKKRLPDPKRFMRVGPPRRQSMQEQRIVLEGLSAMYRIPLKTQKGSRRG